jgi:hypothetical protein
MPLKARLSALTLAGVVAIAPGAALAAGNSVHIRLGRHLKKGKTYTVHYHGKSSTASNQVTAFISTKLKCASTYAAEAAGPFGSTARSAYVGPGRWRTYEPIFNRYLGAHYICAYLHSASGVTLARASHKYKVHK